MRRSTRIAGFVILAAGAGLAQSPGSRPRFEIASVKAARPDAPPGSMDGGPLPVGPFNRANHNPERISWTNVRLFRVIQVAYDFPVDRISGPGWLGNDGYDIVAAVPAGTSVGDFRLMLQDLLAERFALRVHRGTKEVSGYVLEVARGGLKIKESPARSNDGGTPAGITPGRGNGLTEVDASGFPAPRPGNSVFLPGVAFSATIAVNGMYRATVLNMAMPSIAMFLGTAAGMPVEDKTGLAGIYDFHLEYLPDGPGATPPPAAAADIAAPGQGLLDAVQAQLGLKLTSRKVAVEMLVVDGIERVPVEN